MCLRVRKELQTAENDVTCYKVVKVYDIAFNHPHYSLFQDTRIYAEEIEGKEPYTPVCFDIFDRNDYSTNGYIRGRFVHTFATLTAAEKCVEEYIKQTWFGRFNYELAIFRCVIPKGEKYYIGDDQYTGCMAYASKQIYFKEKLKEIQV